MTRAQASKKITLDRDEVEQIAYILGRLETLLTTNDDPLPFQVTQFLTPDTTREWLATWVNELRSNLRRKLFPRTRHLAPNTTQKQSDFRP